MCKPGTPNSVQKTVNARFPGFRGHIGWSASWTCSLVAASALSSPAPGSRRGAAEGLSFRPEAGICRTDFSEAIAPVALTVSHLGIGAAFCLCCHCFWNQDLSESPDLRAPATRNPKTLSPQPSMSQARRLLPPRRPRMLEHAHQAMLTHEGGNGLGLRFWGLGLLPNIIWHYREGCWEMSKRRAYCMLVVAA